MFDCSHGPFLAASNRAKAFDFFNGDSYVDYVVCLLSVSVCLSEPIHSKMLAASRAIGWQKKMTPH